MSKNSAKTEIFCEEVDACDETRVFCVRESATDEGYADIGLSLTTALGEENIGAGYEYAKELFGVFYCEDTRVSCDISFEAMDNDNDGDGIDDSQDLCLSVYDPQQGDFDQDGVEMLVTFVLWFQIRVIVDMIQKM